MAAASESALRLLPVTAHFVAVIWKQPAALPLQGPSLGCCFLCMRSMPGFDQAQQSEAQDT